MDREFVNRNRQSGALLGAFGAGITVARQRLIFALNPGQFGLRSGIRTRCFVALVLQFCLLGLPVCQFAAQVFYRLGGRLSGCLRCHNGSLRVTCCAQFRPTALVTFCLCIQPGKSGLGLLNLRFGDAPFRLNPGVIGGGLGQSQLCCTRGAFDIVCLGRKGRASSLILGQIGAAGGDIAFQFLQGFGGVTGHPIGIAAIFFQPGFLPVEVGQALFGGFQLTGKRGHAVAMGAGIIAPVGQFLARFGNGSGGGMLRLLRLVCRQFRCGNAFVSSLRLRAGFFRSGGGIAPSCEQQPCLCHFDLIGQFAVAFGLLGLTAERGHLRIQPGHQIFQPLEIFLGRAQFAFGILAPHMQASDASSLFQHLPAFGRLGRDHLSNFALTNQSRRMRPGGGIGKGQRDIFGPYIASVDAVGTASAAFDPAGDF